MPFLLSGYHTLILLPLHVQSLQEMTETLGENHLGIKKSRIGENAGDPCPVPQLGDSGRKVFIWL